MKFLGWFATSLAASAAYMILALFSVGATTSIGLHVLAYCPWINSLTSVMLCVFAAVMLVGSVGAAAIMSYGGRR